MRVLVALMMFAGLSGVAASAEGFECHKADGPAATTCKRGEFDAAATCRSPTYDMPRQGATVSVIDLQGTMLMAPSDQVVVLHIQTAYRGYDAMRISRAVMSGGLSLRVNKTKRNVSGCSGNTCSYTESITLYLPVSGSKYAVENPDVPTLDALMDSWKGGGLARLQLSGEGGSITTAICTEYSEFFDGVARYLRAAR